MSGTPRTLESELTAGEASALEAETVVSPGAGARARADGGPSEGVGGRLGRYVVLEEVGRGGMGRVLRAYDPKLQREVALKEVRGAALGSDKAARLVIEARSMAKLSHPNVVAVYDVEELDEGRFVLVMQYVAGRTLSAWLAERSRAWPDVLRAFRDAGRGLAAAHAAGLLHRDFKPANVLVADDGVVRVTDFGLAKSRTARESSGPSDGHRSDTAFELASISEEEGLTVEGTVMGTPRYMAPEQHEGRPLSAAADQYALCVALWEALCGAAPFSGPKLVRQKQQGPPTWPGGPTPRPVVQALVRGLQPEPTARWPSMQALLDALAYDPARRRTSRLLVLAGIAAVGLAGTGWRVWTQAGEKRCTAASAQAKLAGTWDDARRERAQSAVLGVEAAYAHSVWERTAHALDAYATNWTQMHVETCEATAVRGEQSAEVMDLRMACLHRARIDLGAATAVLAEADEAVVHKAHELVGRLPPLSRCADIEALQAEVEPPLPQEAEAVETIREHLAAARAARIAGQYDKAQEQTRAARASGASNDSRKVCATPTSPGASRTVIPNARPRCIRTSPRPCTPRASTRRPRSRTGKPWPCSKRPWAPTTPRSQPRVTISPRSCVHRARSTRPKSSSGAPSPRDKRASVPNIPKSRPRATISPTFFTCRASWRRRRSSIAEL